MRLVQLGTYTAAAASGGGDDPLQTLPAFVWRGSSPPPHRAAPGSPFPRLVLRASGPPIRSATRDAFSTAPHRFAAASAARSARSPCCATRSSFTIRPVSIPSGQAIWQEPSVAQVSSAS